MSRTVAAILFYSAAMAAAGPASAEARHHAWVPPWARVQLPGPPWGTVVAIPSGLAFGAVPASGCAVARRYDFDGNVVARASGRRCG